MGRFYFDDPFAGFLEFLIISRDELYIIRITGDFAMYYRNESTNPLMMINFLD